MVLRLRDFPGLGSLCLKTVKVLGKTGIHWSPFMVAKDQGSCVSQISPRLPYSLFFFCGSNGEESACNAGDPGSIPGSGRSPGEENGTPLQYFGLKNPMGRGAWYATIHGVTKSPT